VIYNHRTVEHTFAIATRDLYTNIIIDCFIVSIVATVSGTLPRVRRNSDMRKKRTCEVTFPFLS